jgi:hypothetical protein
VPSDPEAPYFLLLSTDGPACHSAATLPAPCRPPFPEMSGEPGAMIVEGLFFAEDFHSHNVIFFHQEKNFQDL